eukprot:433626_1
MNKIGQTRPQSSKRPKLTRQQTYNELQEVEGNIGACCILFFVVPSIAAIAIASQYNQETSVCSNNDITYSIEPDMFLFIGAGLQLFYAFIYALFLFIYCKDYQMFSDEKMNMLKIASRTATTICCVFYLIWSAIGLNIYDKQMNESCKNESIGVNWSYVVIVVHYTIFINCIGYFDYLCCIVLCYV